MPNDNGSFAGKVAFITGAANGIGRAAAAWILEVRRGLRATVERAEDQVMVDGL